MASGCGVRGVHCKVLTVWGYPRSTHPQVQKVTEAVAQVKARRPDIPVEGPIQYDAAIDPEVRQGVSTAAVRHGR